MDSFIIKLAVRFYNHIYTINILPAVGEMVGIDIVSRKEVIFRLFLLLYLRGDVVVSQFNLYNTHRIADSNSSEFDCILRYHRYKSFSASESAFMFSWIERYCLRPTHVANILPNMIVNNDNQNFTFNNLRRLNITAEQLLLWSATIDLAEDYQDYLNQPAIASASNKIFFNCTKPWFGSYCQYSFILEKMVTMQDVIDITFDAKLKNANSHQVTNLTCYVHLQCDRGGAPMCLDWREICNGRIDCLDGGLDEMHCFELEVNECGENEFRCSNGLCIAEEYWRGGDANTVCLNHPPSQYLDRMLDSCTFKSSFECDRHSCSSRKPFPCGDGQCVEDFHSCRNGRHHLLMQSMSAQGKLSYQCWVAMTCLTKINSELDKSSCQHFFTASNFVTYIQSCESLTQFPTIPVLFGHVRLLYDIKVHHNVSGQVILPPDYICYDEVLCDFLIPTFRNGSNACRHGYEMNLTEDIKYDSWSSIILTIEPYFRGCSTGHEHESHSQHSSIYRCQNSSKLISKHRIVDGISDCHMNDDEEQFQLSCSLNHSHRFQCHDKDKCRSPALVLEGCPSSNRDNLQNILFWEICDGFAQLAPEIIEGQNHTDETECDHWPCHNIYMQCKRVHVCPDGEDEENCIASICSPSFLLCIDLYNYTLTCLTADRVNDDVVDCLGAIDEPELCQKTSVQSQSYCWFMCRNATQCTDITKRCNGHQDNENFCDALHRLCRETTFSSGQSIYTVHCQLYTIYKDYFSRQTSLTHHISQYKSIVHTEKQLAKYSIINSVIESRSVEPAWVWRCNLGIYTHFSLINKNENFMCFCPPSYYGDLCQYQNQRVTFQLVLALPDLQGIYTVVVFLIEDDEHQQIHSYEQFIAVPKQYCGEFFFFHLLYATRPKNDLKNYSVRIDTFDKLSLTYVASWYFRISFPFLPINPIAAIIDVPAVRITSPDNCDLKCNHGECLRYGNDKRFFCRCHPGWSGAQCQSPVNCKDCSSESMCVGQVNNRSICVCPLTRFGPRCLLTHSCPGNFCHNNGKCIVLNPSHGSLQYACICPEQFSGLKCEYTNERLDIHFNSIAPPSHLFIHIIDTRLFRPSIQKVLFQKLLILQTIVTLHISYSFHMAFIEISGSYYLVVRQQYMQSHLSTSINAAQRCPPSSELLNSTIKTWPRIRQIKYYHLTCQVNSNLQCFFDQFYMCVCTLERNVDCFKFDHTLDMTCRDKTQCLNGGQCFQDDRMCPILTLCICTDCYFGDRCQFYGKGIGLTLDDILRYEIRTHTTFSNQPVSVKISAALTMIMFVMGLVNSVLSFMTFQSTNSRNVGCGIYLLASSITSLLTMTMLTTKFWFLILTQINTSTSRFSLRAGCISTEFLLKLMLYLDNWLNACVAIERAVTVLKGVNFNKSKSQRAARWIVVTLPIFIAITMIHEPLYRNLFDDKEEHRVWCVTMYSDSIQNYNTIILFFHFLVPFTCNLFSALFIIFFAARYRAKSRTELTYKEHLRTQFNEHKHLIISPIILVVLSVPRLIISLLSGCVKSSRNPWLYLFGYFISFIPSVVIFITFVLPSESYKKQFQDALKTYRQRFSRA